MIPPHIRRILEHIASLEPRELTAWGPVWIGTEASREILAALDERATLAAIRALLDADRVSLDALRALVASSGKETIEIRRARSPL